MSYWQIRGNGASELPALQQQQLVPAGCFYELVTPRTAIVQRVRLGTLPLPQTRQVAEGKRMERIRRLKQEENAKRFVIGARNLLELNGDYPVLAELTNYLLASNNTVPIATLMTTLARLMTRSAEERYERKIQDQFGIYLRALDLESSWTETRR